VGWLRSSGWLLTLPPGGRLIIYFHKISLFIKSSKVLERIYAYEKVCAIDRDQLIPVAIKSTKGRIEEVVEKSGFQRVA
jgi:hypothetical protein